jgi:hypothetical protein
MFFLLEEGFSSCLAGSELLGRHEILLPSVYCEKVSYHVDLNDFMKLLVDHPHNLGDKPLPAAANEGAFRSWLVRVLIDEALAILYKERIGTTMSPEPILDLFIQGVRGQGQTSCS